MTSTADSVTANPTSTLRTKSAESSMASLRDEANNHFKTLCIKSEYSTKYTSLLLTQLRADTTQLAKRILEWSISAGRMRPKLPLTGLEPTAEVIMTRLVLKIKSRLPEFEKVPLGLSEMDDRLTSLGALLLDDFAGSPQHDASEANFKESPSRNHELRNSWGQIVLLFALASKLASHNHSLGGSAKTYATAAKMIQYQARLIANEILGRQNVAEWVLRQNGWQGFVEAFKSNKQNLTRGSKNREATVAEAQECHKTEFHTIMSPIQNCNQPQSTRMETVDSKPNDCATSSASTSYDSYTYSNDVESKTLKLKSDEHPTSGSEDRLISLKQDTNTEEFSFLDNLLRTTDATIYENGVDWSLNNRESLQKSVSDSEESEMSDSKSDDCVTSIMSDSNNPTTPALQFTNTSTNHINENHDGSCDVLMGIHDDVSNDEYNDNTTLDSILSIAVPVSAVGIIAYHAIMDGEYQPPSPMILGSPASTMGSSLRSLVDAVSEASSKLASSMRGAIDTRPLIDYLID